ncbi:MAG: electron transfer flavoprotein subunit alpha/FixB family protein [Bacteroidetes bacterium]|nr:electron transfer flavoprotein subunit alpha/FixB family protein [Bacteroidota bacterium]
MSSILCLLSVQDGRIKRSSLEAMSHANTLARAEGWSLEAVLLGSKAADLAETAGRHGADRVLVIKDPVFDFHLNAPLLAGLEAVVKAASPRLVVAASTESVKDVLGALAVRCDAAVLPDVASFSVQGERIVCERPVMAAKKLARTESSHPLVFVSVRSGSYEVKEAQGAGTVVDVPFQFDAATLGLTLREIVKSAGDTVDLSEARVVVAAGRGVRDASGKALVDELASITGAAIGASRAVVETGLFPATAQIGQTGKVVSPDLYFAVGISGAVQHTAGMANSRVIVAINKDPDAPIFDLATYGLVGDCFTILPLLNAELKKVMASR